MLSPTLLEILRNYWKAARPKEWLFPGIHNERPITKDAVEAACQKAHRLSGLSKPVTPHSLRHYLPRRTMSCNFCLCPVLRRKSPVGGDIVWPPSGSLRRDMQRHRFDWSCHGCLSNSGAAKRVRLRVEAHMSGCALFSATIKDSDHCWFCSVASVDGTEGSLEILPGLRTRGARTGLRGGRSGKLCRVIGRPIIRATCNLRLKSQSPVTLRDIVRRGR
jgi:Phage integrase family